MFTLGINENIAEGTVVLSQINGSLFSSPLYEQYFLLALCGKGNLTYAQLGKCDILSFTSTNDTITVVFEVSTGGNINDVITELDARISNGAFTSALQV